MVTLNMSWNCANTDLIFYFTWGPVICCVVKVIETHNSSRLVYWYNNIFKTSWGWNRPKLILLFIHISFDEIVSWLNVRLNDNRLIISAPHDYQCARYVRYVWFVWYVPAIMFILKREAVIWLAVDTCWANFTVAPRCDVMSDMILGLCVAKWRHIANVFYFVRRHLNMLTWRLDMIPLVFKHGLNERNWHMIQ